MALNSPGPASPRTPKSPHKFTFPLKSPSVASSTGSSGGYFTPQSSGSRPPRSPKSPRHCPELQSPSYGGVNRLHYSSSLKHHRAPPPPPIHIHSNPGYECGSFKKPTPRRLSEQRLIETPSVVSNDTVPGTPADFDADDEASMASSKLCRKSTSDLTTVGVESQKTISTSLSRPSSPRRRRKSSARSGLAFLASRRSSRDSMVSNCDSAEDIGPLNFQNTVRGRQRRTSNFLELPVMDHARPRVCSLPDKPYNPRASDSLYRLRTFSITDKGGVVNRGDSICTRSNTSVNSTTSRASDRSPFEGSCCSGYRPVDSNSLTSPEDDEVDPVTKYRVVLLGESGVGKTALVSQFMTSEYMNTYDASLDDEFGEKSVSVLLDGEEAEMIFIDHPSGEMSVENSLSTYEPHACVVVYSIEDRSTFLKASEILAYLYRENFMVDRSVIVVGNKADLARARTVSTTDGKALASYRESKFIETSSGIQHNVDELLVGILKQIKLKEEEHKKKQKKKEMKLSSSRTHISLNIAKELLHKICINDISKSKSCENLHVL